MSHDTSPDVPIVCPECETTTEIPLSSVAESLDRHNERLHEGQEVAQVDPDVAEQLADLVAEDMELL